MRLQDIKEGQWVQISPNIIRRIGRIVYQHDYIIKLYFAGSQVTNTFTRGKVNTWGAVDVTHPQKPVSGTVAIIKTDSGVYRAEAGRLLTNGQQLDENCVDSGRIVARLTWTEGDGLCDKES